jgi:hypothetical protein
LSSCRLDTSAIIASIVEFMVFTSSFATNAVIHAFYLFGRFSSGFISVNKTINLTTIKRNILMVVMVSAGERNDGKRQEIIKYFLDIFI